METNETTPAARLLDQVMNTPEPAAPETPSTGGIRQDIMTQQVVEALTTVYDPEIPVNVYELGLIYDVAVSATGEVKILMTLTSPACPAAEQIPVDVENKVAAIPGVTNVTVEIVWDPPYSPDMMSEVARLQLGLL